ncbi:MAG TPA: hypothetical protein VGY66_27765, partial [Gemmataceae bacterium]|nr:hypothetical protein [Gemmataceae bacterium]
RLEVRPQGFDFADDDARRNRKNLGLDFAEAVFAPDGKAFVLDYGGQVRLIDPLSGKEMRRFGSEGQFRSALVVTPDSRTLIASAWGDRQVGQHPVALFDLSSGGALQRLLLSGTVGGPVAISADGRTFATSVEEPQRQILVYEIASGNLRARVRGVPDRVWSLAFLPDGHRLASGLTNSAALIWDLAVPEILHKEP